MIEFAAGIIIMIAALLVATGAGGALVPPLLSGIATLSAIAGVGLALALHGLYRHARDRRPGDRHWLRTQGVHVAALAAIAVLALVLPVVLAPLGLIRIGGFPLGYYLAAQGLPIALVVIAFRAARMQDSIDIEETADDER